MVYFCKLQIKYKIELIPIFWIQRCSNSFVEKKLKINSRFIQCERKIKSVRNTLDIENAENVIPDLQRPTHVPSYQFPFSTQMNIEMIYNRMAYFLLFCQRDLRFLSKKKKKNFVLLTKKVEKRRMLISQYWSEKSWIKNRNFRLFLWKFFSI